MWWFTKCGTDQLHVLLFPIITSSFDAEPHNSLFSGNTVRKIHLNKSNVNKNLFSFVPKCWCVNDYRVNCHLEFKAT